MLMPAYEVVFLLDVDNTLLDKGQAMQAATHIARATSIVAPMTGHRIDRHMR